MLQLKPQKYIYDPNALYSQRPQGVFVETSWRRTECSGSEENPRGIHAWPPGPGNLCCGVGAAKQQPSPHDRASSKPTAAKTLQDPSAGPRPRPPPPSPSLPHAIPIPSLLLTLGRGRP